MGRGAWQKTRPDPKFQLLCGHMLNPRFERDVPTVGFAACFLTPQATAKEAEQSCYGGEL